MKLVDKKIKKLSDGKCHICKCSDYEVLDLHRIFPGEFGGKYDDQNTLTLCANCHRKVHTGIIRILGKFFTSGGTWVVNYVENGVERMTK